MREAKSLIFRTFSNSGKSGTSSLYDTDPEGLSYVIPMHLRGVQKRIYEVQKLLERAQSP
jgi:hypothetical protein